MNKIILSFLIVFLFQSVGNAEEGDRSSKNFETMKSKVLENTEKRGEAMDTFKNCVKSANSKEELKACRKAKKETMKKLRPKGKGDRMRGKGRGRN